MYSSLELGMFLEEAIRIFPFQCLRQPCTCRNSLSRASVTLQVWQVKFLIRSEIGQGNSQILV